MHSIPVLPDEGFVRLHHVLKVIPVCKSTWWAGVKSGRFPQPVKLGRCTFWEVGAIRELIRTITENESGYSRGEQ